MLDIWVVPIGWVLTDQQLTNVLEELISRPSLNNNQRSSRLSNDGYQAGYLFNLTKQKTQQHYVFTGFSSLQLAETRCAILQITNDYRSSPNILQSLYIRVLFIYQELPKFIECSYRNGYYNGYWRHSWQKNFYQS
jgi:hypothetical protein